MLSQLNKTYISKELAEKLEHIGDCDVTTIAAPMGYGKTKAMDWWISRHSGDRDTVFLRQTITGDSLLEFWHDFCKNLIADENLCREMTALGFPSEIRAKELMLGMLREALCKSGKTVFYILDDLHFISSPKLPELIAFLCDRMPEGLHLVLLSRNNIFSMQSDFKLGSRRFGIDADDLRFSEQGLVCHGVSESALLS